MKKKLAFLSSALMLSALPMFAADTTARHGFERHQLARSGGCHRHGHRFRTLRPGPG